MYNATITGERIKELRGKKSQDQCSKELGISRGALSFYENGERKPDAEILFKMCEYFSVSADYLLGITRNPSTDPNIQNACEITGLTEESIKKLQLIGNMNDKHNNVTMKSMLNELINNEEFIQLLRDCLNLYYFSSEFVEKVIAPYYDDEMIEKTDLQMFRASERFRNILEKLKNPAYEKALQYINNYYRWRIVDGINNGFPFIPLVPYIPKNKIEEEYFNKYTEQAKLDLKEISEIFEQEVKKYAQHNPTSE